MQKKKGKERNGKAKKRKHLILYHKISNRVHHVKNKVLKKGYNLERYLVGVMMTLKDRLALMFHCSSFTTERTSTVTSLTPKKMPSSVVMETRAKPVLMRSLLGIE